jgi:alginate O-acetyltransferase complex protein AlgI
MLFNSFPFLCIFLPLVLLGWWVVFRRPQYRLGFLAFASYVFYSYFEFPTGLKLLPLLLLSTNVDYLAGRLIHGSEDEKYRKRVLIAALSFNLAILGIFKYMGFFANTINALAGAVGLPGEVPVYSLILPIGISFYTFNSMSYTIDIYRRRVEPSRNLLEYSAFVALFPHLIAGPIVRYSDIDSQLRNLQTKLTSRMMGIGLTFFIIGLFKKLVIADSVAPTVNRLYASSGDLTVVTGWAAALGYSFQLYFDFSAYSDMAVGLAMMLGFRFPQNFDSPYKAINPSDFWRRWHISLSRWLRDYLFIPLGGSRGSKVMTLRNLFLTMFIGGLWHGAAWVFVLWGVGHGLLLVGHAVFSERGWTPPWVWLSRSMMFIAVVLLWVPFRSGELSLVESGKSMEVMFNMFGAMFGANGLGLSDLSTSGWIGSTGVEVTVGFFVLLAVLLAFVNIAPNTWEIKIVPSRWRAIGLAGMAVWCVTLLGIPSPFLYFQF